MRRTSCPSGVRGISMKWIDSSFVKGFAGALVACVLAFLAWTAYVDHQNIRAVVKFINDAQAAQQRQASNAGPKN